MRRVKVTCGRCGKTVAERGDGTVQAHRCPHGARCVPPATLAKRAEHCEACMRRRQLAFWDL